MKVPVTGANGQLGTDLVRESVYHATAEGSCTWYEFAQRIFAIANVKANLTVAPPSEFPAKIPPPKYSVLENGRLKALGLNRLQSWEDGLRSYLDSTGRIDG